MLKKGFKKCPWCGRFIERTEGCNFMTCACKKEFCFKCGAIEVDDHQCINGCALFESQTPEARIEGSLHRPPTEDEKKIFDDLYREYKEKTQVDRDFVILNFRRNPDTEEVVEAMQRIFI